MPAAAPVCLMPRLFMMQACRYGSATDCDAAMRAARHAFFFAFAARERAAHTY